MVVNKENKKSLISAIDESFDTGTDVGIESIENESSIKYRCIVNLIHFFIMFYF